MERYEAELEQEKASEAERFERMRREGEDARSVVLDTGVLKRREEIEKSWAKGVKGLADLGKVPGVLAKAERAGKAVAVIEAL